MKPTPNPATKKPATQPGKQATKGPVKKPVKKPVKTGPNAPKQSAWGKGVQKLTRAAQAVEKANQRLNEAKTELKTIPRK